MVNDLRARGFHIEMDDFGAGYSSLNMIATLPIDTLKLDMQFIRTAFRRQKDTTLLKAVIDLAGSLGLPTIAEGVEDMEQMEALRQLGCDIVQGYCFSKPLPAEEFEDFVRNL
ncbi:MAG: EAL domain-containing protein [Erysipelotrichaceae bacterium]|nr:EAL domain-containing protein [Erysipelotrichaceae bacterium]